MLGIKCWFLAVFILIVEASSELSQTSKVELCAKTFNGFNLKLHLNPFSTNVPLL